MEKGLRFLYILTGTFLETFFRGICPTMVTAQVRAGGARLSLLVEVLISCARQGGQVDCQHAGQAKAISHTYKQ